MKRHLGFILSIITFICTTRVYAGYIPISASLDVGESGAANYTVPIEIKESVGGLYPQISLVYNSQSGNGIAGFGWNINGLSSITIGPRNKYFDGTANGVIESNDNAYYLDGMRLMLASGENGELGATYRTESEQFNIITIDSVYNNMPVVFSIRTIDGSLYKYGSSSGRMHYTSTVCYEWALDYVEDRLGNYMTYEYGQDGFSLYIQNIRYGLNKHTSNRDEYRMEFQYLDRNDTIWNHCFNQIRPFTKRLKRINAYIGNLCYEYYSCSYRILKFSHLTSVGKHESGTGSSSVTAHFTWKYAPTTFRLLDNETSINIGGDIGISDCNFFTADIDNDGFNEVMGLYDQNVGGSPYRKIRVWKRNGQTGQFQISNTYGTQAGFSIGDMFTSIRCGGAVAHASTHRENSIILPCFEILGDNRCMKFYSMMNNVQVSYPMRSNATSACHVITDLDKDGLDDIVLIERATLSGSYPATIIHFDVDAETMTWQDFSLNLAGFPQRITSADLNADGMADLLICTSNGYYIYWNQAGQFSDSNRYYGTDFSECDVLEFGDLNGDGLPDLVVNKHITNQWLYAINQGNKNNPFFCRNITKLQNMSAWNGSNGSEAYCFLQDLNGDGKTEIIAGMALYNNDHVFQNAHMLILTPKNNTLAVLDSTAFVNSSTYPAYNRIMQGDFDGDGTPEIMYYGGALHSNSTDVAWHTIKPKDYTASTNRIITVKDGYGIIKKISYDVLTTDSIYDVTVNPTYPLLALRSPLPVVSRIEVINGSEHIWSNYSYKNAIYHWAGKGFLGFLERSTENSSGSTSVIENGVNETYYVPYRRSEKVYANDNSLWIKDTIFTTFREIAPKCFFTYSNNHQRIDKYLCQADTEKQNYNNYGLLIGNDIGDELFLSRKNISYWESSTCPARNLPNVIETIKSGGTAATSETEREEFTRDNTTGQPLLYKKYRNNTLIETDVYTYNSSGQVLSHTNIHGSSSDSLTTTYSYDQHGNMVQEINPLGHTTSYVYDDYGRLSSSTDYIGVTTAYTYSQMGLGVSYSNPINSYAKKRLNSTYNNSVYKIQIKELGKPIKNTFYDKLDRIVAESEERFNGQYLYTDYKYLPNGKVGFVSFPHISEVVSDDGTYNTYDLYGRIISQTDSNGKASSWSYNNQGLVTVTSDGTTRMLGYAHRDIIYTEQDNSGYSAVETDAYARPTYLFQNWKEGTITYNDFGSMSQVSDLLGITRNYSYDANGYLQSIVQGSSIQSLSHDKYGRLLSKTFHDANCNDLHTIYSYNNLNQLVRDSSSNHVYSYTYDQYGRLLTERRRVVADSTKSVTYNYTYNELQQIDTKTIELENIGMTLEERYTYNRGWCTGITLNDSLVWKLNEEDSKGFPVKTSNRLDSIVWNYDVYGHLLSQQVYGQNSISQAYSYDTNSGNVLNWDSNSCQYDGYNRLTRWRTLNYEYDNDGNITSFPFTGNMQYNGFKLTQITNPEVNAIVNREINYRKSIERPYRILNTVQDICFSYNGNAERVWMRYGSGNIRYYLSEDCEIDQNDTTRYFYYVGGGPYDAYAVAVITDSIPHIYQIYRDNIGSIVKYAECNDTTRTFRYTPWGVRYRQFGLLGPIQDDTLTFFTRFYTGHEEIPGHRLINANARLYDPTLGRFLSPDPILATGGAPQDHNPYIYAKNNPLSYVDQDGEFAWFVPLVAAAIGGTLNVACNWNNIHNFKQGLAFFGVGAGASLLSLTPIGAWAPLACGGCMGFGNSVLSQGFNNGWGNINWASVGLSTGISVASSYIGRWMGGKLSGPMSNITGNISNSFVREPLNAALINSVTGFTLGTTFGLITGNNIRESLRYGAGGAATGLVTGIMSGLSKAIAYSRTNKPYQIHHFATNKNSKYTQKMESIANRYGLDLNGDWNKELMPHLGRHPNKYHNFVLKQMYEISKIAGNNREIFLRLYERNVKMPIRNNPDMLYKKYWLSH